MKIRKVKISGFKSISQERPVDIEFGDVSIILGANGSGKSNIISFFKMLNYMMSGSFQSFLETNGGSQSFLYYGSKITQNINGELTLYNNRGEDIYNFTLSFASPDRLIFTQETTILKAKGRSQGSERQLPVTYRESVLCDSQSNSKVLNQIRRVVSNCKVYQFHDSSMTAAMRNSCPIDVNNYLQSEANNIAAFLYRIKNEYPESYIEIVEYIRLVVPLFNDFLLEPNSYGKIMLKWIDNSASDYIFLPNQFSDGSMRFIALATLLLQPKELRPKVIIIDEPELGLHPYAITQLAEMIKDASRDSQIILATQSPELVDEFEVDNILVVEANKNNNRNYTTIKKLDKNELKSWIETYSISELWEKNIIGGRPI